METQKVKFAYKNSSDIRGYSTGYTSGSPILKVGMVLKVVESVDDNEFHKFIKGDFPVYFLRILSADYDKYEAEKFKDNSGKNFRGYSYESNLVFFK